MLNFFKKVRRYNAADWFTGQDHPTNIDRFTPDLAELQMQAQHLLFRYDPIKEERLAVGLTSSDKYVMYKKDLGKESFPLALLTTPDQKMGKTTLLGEPARVAGNLFLVPPKAIIDLDKKVLNGVYFQREKVSIDIPNRKLNGSKSPGPMVIDKVEAWMYVGRQAFWNEQLDGKNILFKPVDLRPANNEVIGKYYFFNEQFESNSS